MLLDYLLLAFSALTSATVLPGSSELTLIWFVTQYPDETDGAWAVATLCNTLGSLLSFMMARYYCDYQADRLRRLKLPPFLLGYAYWALLLTPLPVLGDALPLAAGYLRLQTGWVILMLALGKGLRYGLVLYVLPMGLSVFAWVKLWVDGLLI
jgi:membrane protein YqaA with SNARE-associated domain